MHLIIDGMDFDVRVGVRRTSEMKLSEISGLMLNRRVFNDVLGQYLSYEIDLTYPLYDQGKYASLYEILTKPVDAHVFVLPYNKETVTLTASVETVEDELLEMEDGRTFWRAARFAIIAAGPTKEMSLDEVIARGMTPLPPISSPEVGDAYVYTATGWQRLTDADDTAY